jgi:hypothetical protein
MSSVQVALGDVTGDGRKDLVAGSSEPFVDVFDAAALRRGARPLTDGLRVRERPLSASPARCSPRRPIPRARRPVTFAGCRASLKQGPSAGSPESKGALP